MLLVSLKILNIWSSWAHILKADNGVRPRGSSARPPTLDQTSMGTQFLPSVKHQLLMNKIIITRQSPTFRDAGIKFHFGYRKEFTLMSVRNEVYFKRS